MPRGGSRSGAGRPKGTVALGTLAIIEAALSGGEMPVAYMLRIMRDENAPDTRRDEMAKAAAPFLHPRLALLLPDEPEEAEPHPLLPAPDEDRMEVWARLPAKKTSDA